MTAAVNEEPHKRRAPARPGPTRSRGRRLLPPQGLRFAWGSHATVSGLAMTAEDPGHRSPGSRRPTPDQWVWASS